ncbi:MAG: biotin-independent malonate decarboxylase subunit gamma [Victivallales bacterium]|nr:biotin-independent malonate decarboxylase subunit gamma [Victivallales bacterium]
MTLAELLPKLFPDGHEITASGKIIYGEGRSASGVVQIIGTTDNALIGIHEILELSRHFIEVLTKYPKRPLLMLVDNNGQKMALEDELLGLNQYIAHLVKLQDLARRRGHPLIALVYGNSIAGGFIAFGLCAGDTYALPDSNTSVMILPAIARVTKLPLEYLEELSKTVAVFAPGVENFYKTGGLREIWDGDLNSCLEKALACDQSADARAELGKQRGGRNMSAEIIRKIADA